MEGFDADATKEESLKGAFNKIKEKFGPVTCLIVTAGVFQRKPFLEATASEFQNIWEVNTLSAFLSAKEVLPDMVIFFPTFQCKISYHDFLQGGEERRYHHFLRRNCKR